MYFDELLKDEKNLPFPPSPNTHCCRVRFKNCLFEISTNSARIADSLRYLYRAIIMREQDKTCHAPVRYCYFENNGKYTMTRNGKFAYSCEDFSQAVARFDWMLMSDIVDHHRHLPVIHASAVEMEGKALVFAGRSGSGKSSMALLMGLYGMGFISDDVILATNGITGIPRAICLAEVLRDELIGRKVSLIRGLKKGQDYVYVDPTQIGMEINRAVLPAIYIIFPDKDAQGNKLKQLTPGMVLQGLIENLFDTGHSLKEKLDILVDMAGMVHGAQLKWSDMSAAVKELQAFIS